MERFSKDGKLVIPLGQRKKAQKIVNANLALTKGYLCFDEQTLENSSNGN